MHTIIELSIKGELYFFQNTFTEQQLNAIHQCAIHFFKVKNSSKIINNIDDFKRAIYKELEIVLQPVFIDKVIAI